MKRLGIFVKWFLYITVGIFLVCGLAYTLEGSESIPVNVFWKILLSGFVTTLVTVFFRCWEEESQTKVWVRIVCHYIALCVVMSVLGMWFGWIEAALTGVGKMAVYVGVVYLLAFGAYYIIDLRQADAINKKLQEKYGNKKMSEPFRKL